jgi:hypothetical protein
LVSRSIKLLLIFVQRADRGQPASEFALAAFFHSERVEIVKQTCRLVIAGRVAAFDFLLDLAPHICIALPESLKRRVRRALSAASAWRRRSAPKPFGMRVRTRQRSPALVSAIAT